MSVFIQLTALKRNDKAFTKNILVDVNKIVTPIIENLSGNSIIEVDTDNSYSDDNFRNNEKYEVSENLAAIDVLSNEVFIGSVVSQNGRAPISATSLFIKSKVVGTVKALTPGGNSEFDYKVMSSVSPETYVVTETLANINV